jgi:hypothetical protein
MKNKVINNKFEANLMLPKFSMNFRQVPHPPRRETGPLRYAIISSIKFNFQQKNSHIIWSCVGKMVTVLVGYVQVVKVRGFLRSSPINPQVDCLFSQGNHVNVELFSTLFTPI